MMPKHCKIISVAPQGTIGSLKRLKVMVQGPGDGPKVEEVIVSTDALTELDVLRAALSKSLGYAITFTGTVSEGIGRSAFVALIDDLEQAGRDEEASRKEAEEYRKMNESFAAEEPPVEQPT